MLKPRHQTHRKQSSASSISSFSSTPRKKKPAPPPPKTRQSLGSIEFANNTHVSSPNSLEDSSCSGSEPSSTVTNNEDHYRLHKSTHGKWKRKKGPAPQCPIPQRRRIKPMPIEDIKQELLDIEIKQQELERQGVKLEKDIRLKCNEGKMLCRRLRSRLSPMMPMGCEQFSVPIFTTKSHITLIHFLEMIDIFV